MDVLCTDKTGTLTLNQLTLEATARLPAHRRRRARRARRPGVRRSPARTRSTSRCSAPPPTAPTGRRRSIHALRPVHEAHRGDRRTRRPGAAHREGHAARSSPSLCASTPPTFDADVDRLAATGARVLAVAAGPDRRTSPWPGPRRAGRPAPPRLGAARSSELRALGIDVKMVTGDTPATARSVAAPGRDRADRVHRCGAAPTTPSWPSALLGVRRGVPRGQVHAREVPAGRRPGGRHDRRRRQRRPRAEAGRGRHRRRQRRRRGRSRRPAWCSPNPVSSTP